MFNFQKQPGIHRWRYLSYGTLLPHTPNPHEYMQALLTAQRSSVLTSSHNDAVCPGKDFINRDDCNRKMLKA